MDSVELIFSSDNTSQTFDVDILDDDLTELSESFQIILQDVIVTSDEFDMELSEEDYNRITFFSDATVNIEDNDSK